jgi:Flp pilus assembly protein TadD
MNRKERRAAAKQTRTGNTKADAAAGKVKEAIVLAQEGKFAEAEVVLDAARRLNPQDPELKHQLGMVYVRTGRSDEGQQLLREAVEARPNEALYWNNLAAGYLSVEMSEQGAEAARRAATLLPSYSEAWQNLGFALRDLGRHAEAIESFAKADATGTMPPTSLASWGESMGQTRSFVEAEKIIRRGLTGAPDDAAIQTLLGWVLVEQRKDQEARDIFKHSLDINPNQFLAAFNYGILLLKTPDTAGALRWLRRATSIEIKSAAAWRVLALELARYGHDAEALPAAERAGRLDPHDQAIQRLLQRLKGETATATAVFDFSEPQPIGPEVAPAVAKREKGEGEQGGAPVLDFSTINFGTDKD